MANTLAHARQRFFDAQGVPLAFGKVWTYNAGTNVPRPTFADADEVTTNPNPVILDANGEATIYWSGSYKVNLTTAADVQVPGWPEDNVADVSVLEANLASTADGKGATLVGLHDAANLYAATTVEAALAEVAAVAGPHQGETNILRYVPASEWPNILSGAPVLDVRSYVQTAIDTGLSLYAPGVYKIIGSLDLSNLATLRGDGFSGAGNAGSSFIFYNTGAAPAVTMPSTKTKVFSHIQDIAFRASSWDGATGANGHGLDIAGQLSLTRVQVIGFKKIGIYLHHDATQVGPYESTLTNVRALYSGQHGIVVGRGANSLSIVNAECKWNGAPSFLTAPTVAGSYDGLYVDNYDDGSGWPSYLPEGLTLIGGDASYNSRYGWNIQGMSYGRVMPGYAEFNKHGTYDVNLGFDLQNSFVQLGRVPAAKVNLAATFANYQRTNQVIIGGKSYGAGNTNTAPQNSFVTTNLTQILSENPAGTGQIYMLPDPVTGNLTIGQTGSSILQLGAGAAVDIPLLGNLKFAGVNTTGAGSAALGANCPAATPSAPYTWVRVKTSDGSTGFIPIWK